MLKVIILALVTVLTGQIGSNLLPDCKLCGSYLATNRSKELLYSFCHGGNVTGDRCCFINNRLLGIDLSNCHLDSLSVLSNDEKLGIEWLAVNNNTNLTNEDISLRSFQNLSTFIISSTSSCGKAFNKSKVDKYIKICQQPSHECPGDYCPENSYCLQDGPGLSMCLCNEGWNSYRCLKKSGFPLKNWLIGFAVTTVVICMSLRLLQRKGRKAGKEYLSQDGAERPLNSSTGSE
ncbi:all-trans retinoic acid-induced differentiation factor-like [Hydractinia symbiolongicarpus]|uniref:all-trans retinoic acid-induced differentiation factor-like n=1 Tax=Hydractinia symbiolongicarpus TaxID=13093 RepID=UPI00254E4171|nr:all-trans retinoic acid-induced differentiation factor-like [Hydractinia symbiolongicarpus]